MKEMIEPWSFEIRQDFEGGYNISMCYKCISNSEEELFKFFTVNQLSAIQTE